MTGWRLPAGQSAARQRAKEEGGMPHSGQCRSEVLFKTTRHYFGGERNKIRSRAQLGLRRETAQHHSAVAHQRTTPTSPPSAHLLHREWAGSIAPAGRCNFAIVPRRFRRRRSSPLRKPPHPSSACLSLPFCTPQNEAEVVAVPSRIPAPSATTAAAVRRPVLTPPSPHAIEIRPARTSLQRTLHQPRQT